jgi:hypothetical protein
VIIAAAALVSYVFTEKGDSEVFTFRICALRPGDRWWSLWLVTLLPSSHPFYPLLAVLLVLVLVTLFPPLVIILSGRE